MKSINKKPYTNCILCNVQLKDKNMVKNRKKRNKSPNNFRNKKSN